MLMSDVSGSRDEPLAVGEMTALGRKTQSIVEQIAGVQDLEGRGPLNPSKGNKAAYRTINETAGRHNDTARTATEAISPDHGGVGVVS
jgi:hypothetical protein